MRMNGSGLDLTYCTNIHAGESWSEVEASLAEYALPLKRSLSPSGPFGLGLRLSALAATELRRGNALRRFKDFLDRQGLYVALINGFPYGSFHGETVKANVFAPDWRDRARAEYTLDLVEILKQLVPNGMDGGISTMPLSYKPWLSAKDGYPWPQIVSNIVRVIARMVQIRRDTGQTLHLDIEAEPNGLVESTAELIEFFEGPLRSLGEPALAEAEGCDARKACEHLSTHVQACFDVCHMAVEFEDPVKSLELLTSRGIRIGRIQISSALRVPLDGSAEARERLSAQLAEFTDDVYLHQVIEMQDNGTLVRYKDLDEALASPEDGKPREWRIHFHLPVFTERYGSLLSTQEENRRVLEMLHKRTLTRHLEVETYTWGVLPGSLRINLGSSIERELCWAMHELDELCTRP